MTPFEQDGVYAGIPYRVLPDSSIEAMMPSGLVKFRSMDQLVASATGDAAIANARQSTMPDDVRGGTNERNASIQVPAQPLDYYSFLVKAIQATKQNSAQLRALVYERARFNLKRDILYGYSSAGLADLVQKVNEFEHAVARIEANAIEDQSSPANWEQASLLGTVHATPNHATSRNAVQILPPQPIPPLYSGPSPIQRMDIFGRDRRPEEIVHYVRFSNRFVGAALLGLVFVGTVIIAVTLWPSSKISPPIEIANKLPQTDKTTVKLSDPGEGNTALTDSSPKVAFPLPTSFGVYVLSDNNLTELEPLPINIPDPRVALSAEIKKPSTTIVSDSKPAFILFRRDLVNNAPQKVMLRVIARMARETKIVDGKATTTKIDEAWRIRNISRELKISPIPGQREMVIARADDVTLVPGRYALVLNRVGYDFTIKGPVESLEFCLEGFEAANGSVFTQCRTP